MTDVQSSCDFLLYSVRNSGLNFSCQETPFSIFLTLRKSFVKSFQPQIKSQENQLFVKNFKTENIEEVNKSLEAALANLKNDYLDAVTDSEAKIKTIEKLNNKIDILECKLVKTEATDAKLKEMEAKAKIDKNKTEEINKVNKTLKREIEELNNQVKTSSRDLKTSEKDKRDTAHNLEKKIGVLETKNKGLLEFKALKEIEEKDLKHKIKTVDKKLKTINEREAKLKADKMNFVKEKKENDAKKVDNYSQTDQNPDIPYEVTSPLPPIFSSSLCRQSRRISLFTNSLPNLSTIDWVTVTHEDILRDEAEEALSEQEDRLIEEFYLDERNRVRAMRIENS